MKTISRKVRRLSNSKNKILTRKKRKKAEMAPEKEEFVAGVVEGFYGRPWTFQQRKDLFGRMKALGLNTYLYAPKDDIKHRALWRELYNEEEQENLKQLIKAAKENGITFYYALSPGLDMVFSNPKEVYTLKKKFEQVQKFGCEAFSLLFDDIDPEMRPPDNEVFKSFADAQVRISNEVYTFLGQPKFLFCPTEYCSTRAVPSVENSPYLTTLGLALDLSIDILWTGPKVISQVITPHTIQVLTKVLKRKPIIWDNIHANDYDHRRVFLGPYDGRPVQLYPLLNGILTNPNCEYESNFIPIHTLATWTKCAHNALTTAPEEPMSLDQETEKPAEKGSNGHEELTGEPMEAEPEENVTVSKDSEDGELLIESKADEKDIEASSEIKDVPMEPESTSLLESKSSRILRIYDPQLALVEAVKAWLTEFSKVKMTSSRFYAKSGAFVAAPQPVPVQTYAPMPMATVTTSSVGGPVCSSKLTCTPSATQAAKANSRRKARESPSPPPEKVSIKAGKKEDETPMEVGTELFKEADKEKEPKVLCKLSADDLLLLVDLFYLPYHHGTRARQLIGEFKWLKSNAVKEDSEAFQELTEQEQKAKICEWGERAEKFHLQCGNVSDMFVRLADTPNRALLYDLYPYVWDVKEIVLLLDTFITWLGSKSKKKKQKTGFYPEDPEPWMFRGGICADLQRLLPIDGGHEIFSLRAPDVPTMCVYTIRPYQLPDEKSLYDICLLTCDDGQDGHDLFPSQHKMPGDKFIKPYLQICPENVFVVEDEYGLCGYAVATTDAKQFYEHCKAECLPEMCKKYGKPAGDSKDWTYSERIADSFHNPDFFLPNDLYSKYRSHVRIDILPRAQGRELGKRLLACMLSALKDEGLTGVYCELSSTNRDALEFYTKLGFHDVPLKAELPEDLVILGRTF